MRYASGDRLFGLPQLGGLLIILALLHVTAQYNFLLFHSVVEALRVVILGGIFVLAWHTRHLASHGFLLILGIASIFVAALEMLHLLAYKGLSVFPRHDANLPTQLWIAFRYLESVSFLFAAAWADRTVRPYRLAAAYGGVTIALAAAVFSGFFPDCFVEGSGLTAFKIQSEYLIVGIFFASLFVLHRRCAHFDRNILRLLTASILFGAASGVSFTRYASVFGMANEIGHYLLYASSYFIYRAILVSGLISPVEILFRQLKQNESKLETIVAERTAALRQSQALNTVFFENSPSVIFLTDAEGRYTLANPAFEQLVQRPREAILGKTVFDLFSPELAPQLDRNNRAVLESGRPGMATERFGTATIERIFETVHFPVLGEHGERLGAGGIANDVTDLHRAEARYGSMIRTSMDAFVILDSQGRFVDFNDAACELSGYSRARLLAMRWTDVEAEMEGGATPLDLRRIALEGSARFDSRWRRLDGGIREVEVSINHLHDTGGPCYFSFIRDISERKAAHARIEYLAHHDQLTGLPNKLLFEHETRRALQAAAADGQACALAYLDLDNFKVVNDTLGHRVGDAMLCHLGARLREVAGDAALLCRLGGDEFLLLLQGLAEGELPVPFIEQLNAELAKPLHIDEHELVNTVSVGIALFPRDGEDFEALLKNADAAMFVAKACGRSTYRFFDAQMQAHAQERLQMLRHLRNAIERQELRLHYQPQISLDSGRLVGAEALIRWQHPELGLIPPARFIPLAEDSGLIVPIGAWVLREACRQAVAWQQAGLPRIVVAVNLSAIQFRQHDVYRTVLDALNESGLEPACLELELTESLLIGDAEGTLQTLRRLKLLGVQLSIDDFGTGYSSLAYLKRFAVDKLKIDQSFVRDMDTDPDSRALVLAIIQMARNLGLRTIAEGVEHGHLLERLRRLECDEAQGYHIGHPMPAADFGAYLLSASQTLPSLTDDERGCAAEAPA